MQHLRGDYVKKPRRRWRNGHVAETQLHVELQPCAGDHARLPQTLRWHSA